MVSQRGTRGSRALRRGRVNTSTGLRAILSRRTAHLPKLPNVANCRICLVSVEGQAVGSAWELKRLLRGLAGRTAQIEVEREGKRERRKGAVPLALP